MLELYKTILGEAGRGNFSFYILVVNVLQLMVAIAALIVAVVALLHKEKK